jgi:hypothetical protein
MKLGLRGGVKWAAVAAIAVAACAADPGDDPKGDGSGAITTAPSGSSGSSGGAPASSGAGEDAATTGMSMTGSDGVSDATPSSGDDAAPGAEAAPPPPSCTTCPLTVEYSILQGEAQGSVGYWAAISNNGALPQALSELKLRYWFTADGATTFTGNNYYAAAPLQGNIAYSTFVKLTATSTPPASATADTYMEVSFDAAAGSIAAMSSTIGFQLEFNDTSYAVKLNVANDYSYNASDTAAVCVGGNNAVTCQSMAITLYRNGALVWGVEPGGAAAAAGDP